MAAHDAHASSLPFSLLLFPLTAQTKRTRLKEHFLSQSSRSRLLTAYASLVLFQTNKGSSQIRAAIPYLTDQIRAKVSLTLICSGLPLFD